jgi:hypothetical protein
MLNLADIAGTSSAVSITLPNSANSIGARWVMFVVTGSGTVRVAGQSGATPTTPGTPLASATLGIPVVAAFPLVLPTMGSDFVRYQLNEFSVYVPTGTTLSVAIKEG